MNACAALGHGQQDHSALVRALEALAQHTVTPD
jgi:2-hydroxy-3-oxopropionate reductase